LRCPFCGEELEPENDGRGWRRRIAELVRRDYEPHRGSLIVSLGNVSMLVGGLSLCLLGFGALVSVPLGVLVWLMAHRDLELMREGRMDPRGKAQTETGRTGAIAGIVLGLIFAAFYALLYLAK
jgi:Na+/proline symporter